MKTNGKGDGAGGDLDRSPATAGGFDGSRKATRRCSRQNCVTHLQSNRLRSYWERKSLRLRHTKQRARCASASYSAHKIRKSVSHGRWNERCITPSPPKTSQISDYSFLRESTKRLILLEARAGGRAGCT